LTNEEFGYFEVD